MLRRTCLFNTDRIDHLYRDPHVHGANLRLRYGDLSDGAAPHRVLDEAIPLWEGIEDAYRWYLSAARRKRAEGSVRSFVDADRKA